MTVEEILVKFTGDASSFVNASDKARGKTKDISDELLKLDRVMQVAKAGTAGYEQTLAKLEQTARKYVDVLDKIKRQENANSGSVSIAQKIGDSIRNRIQERVINAGESVLQQTIEDYTGLTSAVREYNKQLYESQIHQKDSLRVISDIGKQTAREAALLKDPITGELDQLAQRELHSKKILENEERVKQSRISLRHFEKEMERKESSSPEGYKQLTRSQVRKIPMIGQVEQFEFEQDEKNIEEQRQKIEAGRELIRQSQDVVKGIDAGGGVIGRFNQQAVIDNNAIIQQIKSIGLTKEQNELRKEEERLERIKAAGGAKNNEEYQKAVDLLGQRKQLLQEVEAKERQDQKRKKEIAENEGIDERLKKENFAMAARGFKGAEAEVLARHAAGKKHGNAEILRNADILAADSLKESLMTPFERGMREKERIDRIRDQLDPETYQRAMANIDKGMRGPDPAASRAATGYGSAEHSARMYAYGQVMTQPATQKANIDRLAQEPGKTADKQTEANNYLRSIRDSIKGKKTVEVQPANLGGG